MAHSKFVDDVVTTRTRLHGSNYLQILRQVEKTQTVATVKESLVGVPCGDGQGWDQYCGGDLGQAFQDGCGPLGAGDNPPHSGWSVSARGGWMWTAPYAYQRINKFVINDDATQLRQFMPLIRTINRFITDESRPEQDVVTFRGSRSKVECFVEGIMYRFGMYVATSTNLNKAISFYNENKYAEENKTESILEFHIPKGCYNAGYLEPVTYFAGEEEYLLPPYTAATCREIRTKNIGGEVVPYARFDVAFDNLSVEKEFEKYADLYVSTHYYQALKDSATTPLPDVTKVATALLGGMMAIVGLPRPSSAADFTEVAEALPNLAGPLSLAGDDPAKFAAAAFALEEIAALFGPGIKFIQNDSREEIRHYLPWLLGLLEYFHTTGNEACICYRLVPKEWMDGKNQGKVVLLSNGFWCCSQNMQVANQFMREGTVLIMLKVPANSPFAADLQSVSPFPEEGEVTMIPYTMGRRVMDQDAMPCFEILDTKEPGSHILNNLSVANLA